MSLKSLQLRNFRSYQEADFSFKAGINLVLGPNGAGKTNLLEAAYFLSSARSFRAKDRDMVAKGQDWLAVEGEVDKTKLQVTYQNGKKALLSNNKPVLPERFVGQLPSVLFEPASVNIVAGAPEDRRRFLNRLLSTIDPRYLRTLIDYRRVLKQRNTLLRRRREVNEQIFAWDIKLVELADYLFQARQQLAAGIHRLIEDTYHEVAQERVAIDFIYSSGSAEGSYAERLLEQLTSSLERDMMLGFTSAGPHRDDVLIGFNNRPAGRIASRGEQRTLTLALKLLELGQMEALTNRRPLVLLDDVFSELDSQRRNYLLERLRGYQSLITATDAKGLKVAAKGHAKIELGKANVRRRQNLSSAARQTTRSGTRPSPDGRPKTTRAQVSRPSSRSQPQRRRPKAGDHQRGGSRRPQAKTS